ncbi:MAG: cysteine hydrolase [Deltaproteobacteria bacterium]|nr:cysteine hydrolase [Deltaproteobacteria bacterium]
MNEKNWLRTLAERVNPQTTALIILDMLKANPDAPPSMEIPRIRGPLQHLIQLIASGRRVLLPIIYVRNSHSDWTVLANLRYAWSSQPNYSPHHYAEGTRAVEFHDGLEPKEGEAILIKHSYSAFAHGPLDLMLRCRGIKSVLLTGGAVMGAVEAAAKECFVRGYYLVVVSDCVVPASGPDHEIVLNQATERLGAIVAPSDEIMRVWDALPAKENEGFFGRGETG